MTTIRGSDSKHVPKSSLWQVINRVYNDTVAKCGMWRKRKGLAELGVRTHLSVAFGVRRHCRYRRELGCECGHQRGHQGHGYGVAIHNNQLGWLVMFEAQLGTEVRCPGVSSFSVGDEIGRRIKVATPRRYPNNVCVIQGIGLEKSSPHTNQSGVMP